MERRRFVAGALGAVSGLAVVGGAGEAWARSGRATGAGARAAAEWTAVPAPGTEAGADLRGVVAVGAKEAWAVGEEARAGSEQRGRPLAMRWDGTAWAKADTSALDFTGGLASVAATAPDDVWAVGATDAGAGRLAHWDGSAWRLVDFPGGDSPDTVLWAVTAGSDGELWATGRQAGAGRLLHRDGGDGKWTWLDPLPVDEPGRPTMWSAAVGPGGAVWVAGDQPSTGDWEGFVARWDGEWTVLPGVGGIRSTLVGLLPVADDDVWAIGAAYGAGGPVGKPTSAVLQHWDGKAWTKAESDIGPGRLLGIVADGAGQPAWICGWEFWDQKRSAYLRWDGSSWQLVRGPEDAAAPGPYVAGVTRLPESSAYLSVGRTTFTQDPPAEAYGEILKGA